eukprot:13669787-Alexandrium_andersonii.AAC.1
MSVCVTPRSRIYLRKRKRFMLDQEALSLQGVGPSMCEARVGYIDAQLRDLAGNAFSAFSFVPVSLSGLLAAGKHLK